MQKSSASGDLVLCQYHTFDNRWKHLKHQNDLVDYNDASIRFWNKNLLSEKRFPNVRRAKICRLPDHQPTPLDPLLHSLDADLLEQLEFDQLVLVKREQTILKLKSLQVFSVDSVEIVHRERPSDKYTPVTPRQKARKPGDHPDSEDEFTFVQRKKRFAQRKPVQPIAPLATQQVLDTNLKCDAPNLFAVYLGSNSVHHVKFKRPESITTLEIECVPYEGVEEDHVNLGQFKSLQILELNQVQNFNLEHILKIARGGRLKQLFCNTSKLTSTTYRPTETEYNELKRIFQTLQDELKRGDISDSLEIFLHQVLLGNNQRAFTDFGFDKQLANLYFINWVAPGPDVRPAVAECASVVELDYVALHDYLPNLSLGDVRLEMLFVGFPNIQRIILDNTTAGLSAPRLADRFGGFLERCKALTELTLKNSNFTPSFYDDLASMDSVRYLNSLAVFEQTGFAEPTDFRFLQQFEYLRLFKTNLVNKRQTLGILSKMRVNSEYSFTYQQAPGTPRNQLVAQSICRNGNVERMRLTFIKDSNFPNFNYGNIHAEHECEVEKLAASVFYSPKYQTFFSHWKRIGESFD